MENPSPAPGVELQGSAVAGQQDLIKRATVQDADAIRMMVHAAYSKYVERIGREPAPMKADQRAIIADPTQDVYVLRRREDGKAAGCIVLSDSELDDSVLVNNLVVDPGLQGRGYGRLLMDFAGDYARAKGRSALRLFTNEKMYENLGFVQVDKRVENGYHRVYFRKQLAPTAISQPAWGARAVVMEHFRDHKGQQAK